MQKTLIDESMLRGSESFDHDILGVLKIHRCTYEAP